MGEGIIGKILYFWIFIIGALVFAKVLHFFETDRQLILFLIAVAIVYVVWTVMRELGKKRRADREWAENRGRNSAPVHKGQSNKKKKRR